MDVLLALGNFQRYMEQLDLRKANGQLLPEIQVAFFLEHQGPLLMNILEIVEK